MAAETNTKQFSLQGKWKLVTTGTTHDYLLPGYLVFREKNIYSVEGREEDRHPLLDGGAYEYDKAAKELKINTANDAIKKFRVEEKSGAFVLYENERMIAGYKKVND